MDKNQAIEKLQTIKDKLQKLPKYNLESNFEFEKWHRETEFLLERIFDNNPERLKKFTNINFMLIPIFMDGEDEGERYHNEMRQYTIGLLDSFIEDIEEYGVGQNNTTTSLDVVSILESILNNFHRFALQLLKRRKNDGLLRETIKINDEYDVQDLLHAILKLFFDDVRDEEPTPSRVGGSARMDFFLNDHGIAIEVKMTRIGLTDRKIGDELIIDIERYQAHPDIKCLICFIYDPSKVIQNPSGVKNYLIKKSTSNFKVDVIICPE